MIVERSRGIAFDSAAEFDGGAGSCSPFMMVVALVEPGTPLMCCVWAAKIARGSNKKVINNRQRAVDFLRQVRHVPPPTTRVVLVWSERSLPSSSQEKPAFDPNAVHD
jgi:hypothetical protein